MKYLLPFLILFIFSCTSQKSLLICGDHKCINKAEAKQYFEENLTIEVQIISKDVKSNYNLVDLNIDGNEPDIKIYKSNNNKIVKKLSKTEIKQKKVELRNKKKKNSKTKISKKSAVLKNNKSKEIMTSYIDNNSSLDICLKLKKCNIDSITNYLIKASNEKNFPNISLKE